MVLALLMLTLLATLSVAIVTTSSTSVQQAGNLVAVQRAQLQAEGGMGYLIRTMSSINLPGAASGQQVLDGTAAALATALNGTNSLRANAVAYEGAEVCTPEITMGPSDQAFSAVLSLDAQSNLRMVVTGRCGSVRRQVGVGFGLVPGGSGFFDYGIASKGKINMTGNARVGGANDPSEANILAATYSDNEAIKLAGNCRIDGDISISNPDGYTSLAGNVSVGGESISSDAIDDHIHVGIGPVEFPEVDPTVFEPFATNLVTSSTSTSGNKTFENIRIAANANKTFSGNITLKGVIFIEAPNKIHFSGNVTITGVIVTEDAGDNAYDDNTLKFTGNTTVKPVTDLPDTPQFSQLRQMPGAFLLAPGFSTQFTGNFGTVSGCMAADQFKFTGNAGGTVAGGVINYGDTEFKLTGNSNLIIDRSDSPDEPPGFSVPGKLAVQPDSYFEP
jgi:hypothetical protein